MTTTQNTTPTPTKGTRFTYRYINRSGEWRTVLAETLSTSKVGFDWFVVDVIDGPPTFVGPTYDNFLTWAGWKQEVSAGAVQ